MTRVSTDALALAVIWLHGVIDVSTAVVAEAWGLFATWEGNPIVLALGFDAWLYLNTAAVAAFVPIYLWTRELRVTRWCLYLLVALGATLILPNLGFIASAIVA
ncbi:MAG: hypothetical protein ACOCR0_01230 [Haloferacaceae archaeon]